MVGLRLLLLAHDRQDPDEDVGEVEEDVDRDVDRVVHRLVETARHVQVVDHDGAEQDQYGPVQDPEGQLEVESQRRQDDAAELDDDRSEQQPEQRSAPGRQVLRQQCANEPGGQDDTCRQNEGLNDTAGREQGHERSDHQAHRARTDGATHHRDCRVIVGVCQNAATDRSQQADCQEAEVQPLVTTERPAVTERGPDHGDDDEDGREAGDRHHERTVGHGVGITPSTLLVKVGVDHQLCPFSKSRE